MELDAFRNLLETLHRPGMTPVEEGLRECWTLRPDVHNRILSGAEMADYVLWMIDNFGDNRDVKLNDTAIPSMILGGGISELGQSILHDSGSAEDRAGLLSLYESSQENRFFQENEDVSAGIFLRYLPAYWRQDEYFEVYYVFSGACPVSFEKERVTLNPGSVLIVPPGIKKACCCPADDCMAYFFMVRKSTFAKVFWSHMNAQNLMANFFTRALSGDQSIPYLRFETGQDLRIESLLVSIHDEYRRNRKYSAELLNALMSSFFLWLLQEHEETARISHSGGFRWKSEFAAILSEIQDNYAEITLDELAGKYGYSRRQLIRIIQSCTGSNFTELQTRLRMEKAARLLNSGTASVESIADEVGFSDLPSFYRAFKRYFGTTPGKFQINR